MVQMSQTKVVPVEAKTLSMNLKVRDCFSAQLIDADGNEIGDYEGYVPDFMPGNHYGDYVELKIDLETGQITNWKTPTAEQLEKVFVGRDEEDD